MKIKALDNQSIEELSMIEVAHAILEQNAEEMAFPDIAEVVKDYLQKSDEEMAAALARFYTELNTDGSFIPVDGKWALRAWFPIDSIDEETISLEYFEEAEVIDDSVDPALLGVEDDDADFKTEVAKEIVYDEDTDDEQNEAAAYDEDLAEVAVDDDILNEADEVVDLSEEDDDDDDLADTRTK
ncbi:MAG: DNA-directed RNA polymerase subunit delta [Streptococcaceae bacterium]|jgi:DNA-directed RNA polymerase subunit delta|nr:DNA-directed RNA polymerase subunit delta [Streptococcaceae bacterium]